jgi:phosphopantothenoylcysteine decarboxylase/phosphopantothenate--cysteine ligase
MDILLTAGATRNPIDSMRYISANSSGQSGAWLAQELTNYGTVHLMGSPEALLRCQLPISKQPFGSTEDLMGKMKAWVERYPTGIVVHAAAVGDYAVPDADESVKVPSGEEGLSLELKPTPKILNAIRGWSESVGIISFKAAGPNTSRTDLEAMAKAQAARSDSSIILGNTIGALEGDVLILDRGHLEWFASRPLGMAALVAKIRAMVS